ncbi:hypothetical protein BCR33DRAFT_723337 [Rhizoclosmatium globosum]|uniref:Uncharacterized protein n=1 Tax=Rhizoclosmatium globosum TaxID=329046 RepID=A0A1Y2BE67_9FUNG|nr:hypothetical protein BCR33DRAFT_723337 [Rhizoclosmatium globosum]|eukprot:ORY32996.1 hypothetical protein BCR33DRAFT_723337 [Rhizoclosmatium globosum]
MVQKVSVPTQNIVVPVSNCDCCPSFETSTPSTTSYTTQTMVFVGLLSFQACIISNYGLAACCFVFITLGCVAACLICLLVNLHAQNEQVPNIYRVFWMIKDVSLSYWDSSHIDDRIRESLAAQESVASEGVSPYIPRTLDRRGSSVRVSIVASTNEIIT